MNNEPGASSITSGGRERRSSGVSKRCWCGEVIIPRTLKSDANPYRRYYRCAFAVEKKLSNDNHIFKWVNEALLNEIDALTIRTEKLEQVVADITSRSMEAEKKMFEDLQMKLEKENFERVEEVIAEAKSEMKKMALLVDALLVSSKLVGSL
ncbi:uncharacterized protein At4g04775-like [Eutrema salsugineum]|uniref:uncharacterized protein At4g04775-like n=1 Tax=Eutrema salsugineum TaxID=72664 RepID=UPI000CED21D2|nr:uncharacterized protein At4g04775-like [Eutrema salsugineum]